MDYYKKFNAQCDVIDVHGGKAGYHPGLYNKHLDEIRDNVARGVLTLTLDEMRTKAMETSCEEYKASLFMRLANENRFKDLKNQLDDMNLFNREAYPKTMDQALRYLQNYKVKRGSSEKQGGGNRNRNRNRGEDAVAFHTSGNKKNGGGRDISNDDCYNCNKKGHHAKDCRQISPKESANSWEWISVTL
jgi:hypothetical protein